MASHTPIYQKRGSTVVPVITIDDAPSKSAAAAGHLVDSNGIANAIAAVEAKIPDLEGVKDIRVSGTTMTVTYIDDSTKTFTLAVSSSTTGPTYSDFVGATASAAGSNGLVPAPAKGKQTSFLRGDGTWAAVPNPDMIGASSTSDGVHGLVPQPKIAEREKYLRGDGTWSTPPDTDTTYSVMTKATASAAGTSGLVPAPGAGKQASFLRGDGTWVVPTNTTYSNMTAATASAAGTAGLVPAPGAGKQASFLRGDGTWVVPTNTTYSVFTGATTDTAGTSGLVPQPAKGTAGRFLRVDGTWSTPPDTNTTYSVMTKATASAAGTSGLVPAPAAGKQTSFLRGDGTWVVPTNTTYSDMTGATSSAAGAAGLVPAPAKGQQNYYLKGDGTWVAASWLPLTGGTLNSAAGTAGTAGSTGLTVGNSKSIDADGNSYGFVRIYGKTDAGDASAHYGQFVPTRLTANRTYTLPNSGGYVAVGSTSGVGDANTPVYMSSSGVLTACSFSKYSAFTGATSSAAGAAGLVPAPAKGQQNYYLKGDGTWVAASWLPLTGGTVDSASGTAGTNGYSRIVIGNNKSIDVDGNAYGRLALYGKTAAGDTQAYYTFITPSRFTANRTHTLPNASGYLATGSTSGVGDATTPVYMSSAGVLTACSGATGRLSLGDIAYYYGASNYKDVTVSSKKQGSIQYKYAKIPSGGSWLVFVGTSHSGGYSSFSFYSEIAAGGKTYTVLEDVDDNSESGNGNTTSRTVLAIKLNS